MKALFGLVSLLVVLGVIGMLASKQLKTTGQVASVPASGTVVQQSQQIQDKVRDDVTKALEQGARRNEAGQ